MIWASFILLDKNWQKLFLISFCFIYSVVFLNVFVPFNINLWENDEGLAQFIRLSKFAAIGVSVLGFSQFGLRKFFKVLTFKFVEFIAWASIEVMVIALVISIIYHYNAVGFWSFYLECLHYSFLVIVIPYTMALLIIYVIQLKQKRNIKIDPTSLTDLIGIPDEKDVIKLSIPLSCLLYFESADNYVIVYFIDDTKIKKKLIRNTLKNLERTLDNSVVKRSHRSYIVNLNNIKLIEKISGKYFIHIKNTEIVIPISANYTPQFETYFS